jgi:hypothetical protein
MQAPSRTRELLVALFLLGALLLAPPLLIIFNKATRVLGIPTLYLYLFVVWTTLIALVAVIVEPRDWEDNLAEGSTGTAGTEPAGGKQTDA